MSKQKGKILINVNDVIGKHLGKLVVISYAGHHYTSCCSMTNETQRMRHFYVVHCECGTTKIVQRGQLTSEIVHSCGCGKKRGKRK